MKFFNKVNILYILLFMFQGIIQAAAGNDYRAMAESWTSSTGFTAADTDACEALLKIQMDSTCHNLETLHAIREKCEKYVQSKNLHHGTRVYARANLALILREIFDEVRSDFGASSYVRSIHFNCLVGLALARSSGSFRQAQETMFRKAMWQSPKWQYMVGEDSNITVAQIDEMVETITSNPLIQFAIRPI